MCWKFRDCNVKLVRFMPVKKRNIVISAPCEDFIVQVDMYKYQEASLFHF